jgi:hypothetical protein
MAVIEVRPLGLEGLKPPVSSLCSESTGCDRDMRLAAHASALAKFAFWIEIVRNFTADFP